MTARRKKVRSVEAWAWVDERTGRFTTQSFGAPYLANKKNAHRYCWINEEAVRVRITVLPARKRSKPKHRRRK